MDIRLLPPMETLPQVQYEYDYVGGELGNRRVLDSAFLVAYEHVTHGVAVWRQRNVTLVGGGDSLCVIGYAPALTWKKSAPTRTLLNAVLGSVTFTKAASPRPR
jgi:hypothetical protein